MFRATPLQIARPWRRPGALDPRLSGKTLTFQPPTDSLKNPSDVTLGTTYEHNPRPPTRAGGGRTGVFPRHSRQSESARLLPVPLDRPSESGTFKARGGPENGSKRWRGRLGRVRSNLGAAADIQAHSKHIRCI